MVVRRKKLRESVNDVSRTISGSNETRDRELQVMGTPVNLEDPHPRAGNHQVMDLCLMHKDTARYVRCSALLAPVNQCRTAGQR